MIGKRLLGSALLGLALAGCAPPAASPVPRAPAAEGTLVVLGTTDTHGWLLPRDYYTGRETPNGLARLVPAIDSVRAANPGATILVDSGDLLQGSPLDFVYSRLDSTETHPVAAAMNALGYDAAAIGNHEFNYGIEHLDGVARQAGFPFLSANVFRAGTDEHAYRPYTLVERTVGGRTVRVGITAVTPPGVLIWDRDNVKGRLDFHDIVTSVAPVVREMRERGADVVVVAAHSGLQGSSYDTAATGVPVENAAAEMARRVPGIDVVFMGHTHREVADTSIAGVLVLQAKNWGGSLAIARLRLRSDSAGRWRVVEKRGSLRRARPGEGSPRIEALLAPADARARAYVSRRIGTSTAEWSTRTARVEDTPILDLINEVQRRATGADLSAASAFTLSARIPDGPITVGDVAGLYVYDNTLKALRVSGAQVARFLETSAEYYLPCPAAHCERIVNPAVPGYNFDVLSGVDYTLDLSRPVGQRVVKLERDGRAVAPTDTFTLAVNNYRAGGSGGYSMLAGAPVVYDRGESIRDLLIAEVERKGTLSPADYYRENWEIVPAPLREQALREQGGAEDSHGGVDSAARRPAPRLRVLATNDFHGALEASRPGFARGREVGGAAAMAAYLRRERSSAGATVLIDAGDVMQGTPISNLTWGRATVDYYNRAGYTAAALGNHEFDWGIDTLRARVTQASFGWLAANVVERATGRAPEWVEPAMLVSLPGCGGGAPACDSVKVGIVGIATESTPTTTRPSNVASLRFEDEAAAVDRWVPRLRAGGADFVVVTAHSGAFCDRDDPSRGCAGEIVDVARRLRHRPDLIVSGHTHSLVNTVVNGVPIVQANSGGTRLSVVDLKRVSVDSVAVRVVEQPTTYVDELRPDSAIGALVAGYRHEVGPRLDEVVTVLSRPLMREGGEYALGDLIADAQRAAAGTQVAVTNNGGIRTELGAGPVRYADVFRLQPFANTLVTMELTGAQLLAALEHGLESGQPDVHVSGVRVRYDPAAPGGRRVREATLDDGSPIRPDARYSVAVNDFMAEGGSGFTMLKEGTGVVRTGIVDLDALIDYLRARPRPLPLPAPDRMRPVG